MTVDRTIKAALTSFRSVRWRLQGAARNSDAGLRILLYHRVSDDGDPLSVPPRRFRQQMDHLASEGYRAVALEEAVALLDGGAVPPRTVALTFDDAFADVRDEALGAMERHGFRATVFVTTGVTGGRLLFPWYSGPQPPVMGWDDVVALDRDGTLRFEAHTVSHPDLPSLSEADAREEISACRLELEQRLGRPVTAFAYPSGLFGERERRLVAAAGYAAAVSCEPGVNLPDTDRLTLRRRQIDPRDSLLDFRAKLGGGHDTPLPLRGVWRRYGMRRRSSRS